MATKYNIFSSQALSASTTGAIATSSIVQVVNSGSNLALGFNVTNAGSAAIDSNGNYLKIFVSTSPFTVAAGNVQSQLAQVYEDIINLNGLPAGGIKYKISELILNRGDTVYVWAVYLSNQALTLNATLYETDTIDRNSPQKIQRYSTGGTPINSATTTQLFAAAGAGIRNYLTDIQFHNNNATATEIQILDGASTIIFDLYAPASMTFPFTTNLTTPLQGSANTIMNLKTFAAGQLYVSAGGYTGN